MARQLMLLLAIAVSAFVSWLLARAITRPVTKLRHATVSLAEGDLDARVAESVGSRRDELGLLARDFDLMADNLQRTARQQTELSRNISHELRSPLARMRVALELARRQSGDLAEFERIDSEAERLDSLIGQILSYTRLDTSVPQKTEMFDLADLIQEVVENVNFECRSEGIDGVSVQAHADVATPVAGDRYAMASAVENVLRNAVRHSPSDAVVSITLRQEAAAVVIEIVDQGPGVDENELPHLFDAFFRTSQSTADAGNHGTGLGLAIAKRAVKLNGGEIVAESADGAGLRVKIVLPRAS
jgi:two-component system sensor histidine kinase CpxA